MDEDAAQEASSERTTTKDAVQWPDWLVKDHGYLAEAVDGDDWATLIGRWVAMEESMGFPSGQGKRFQLAATGRPVQLSRWVSRRDYSKSPVIDDVKAFTASWRAWWIGLQPEWRGSKWPLAREVRASEAWSDCRKGGRNGFAIVLITLSWW
ncbi:hypothetical protein FA95DRAFT_1495406, partial [Auriscalpium vulgare]